MSKVLVICPICNNEKFVDWDQRKDSKCFVCPDKADSPPTMKPVPHPNMGFDEVAFIYITEKDIGESI